MKNEIRKYLIENKQIRVYLLQGKQIYKDVNNLSLNECEKKFLKKALNITALINELVNNSLHERLKFKPPLRRR